jgi:hypothetical protein
MDANREITNDKVSQLRWSHENSVQPILGLLEQCQARKGIEDIPVCILSTSYVQPPLPFLRPAIARVPFLLKDYMTASKLQVCLMSGEKAWSDIKREYDGARNSYYKV